MVRDLRGRLGSAVSCDRFCDLSGQQVLRGGKVLSHTSPAAGLAEIELLKLRSSPPSRYNSITRDLHVIQRTAGPSKFGRYIVRADDGPPWPSAAAGARVVPLQRRRLVSGRCVSELSPPCPPPPQIVPHVFGQSQRFLLAISVKNVDGPLCHGTNCHVPLGCIASLKVYGLNASNKLAGIVTSLGNVKHRK